MEEKLAILINANFNDGQDYGSEKFIKCFAEGLGYLEKLMMFQRNIHFSQFSQVSIFKNKEDIAKKYMELEKIMISEIDRQYRNYIIFIAALKDR